MDFDILKKIMLNHFNDKQVNEFRIGSASTLQLVKNYVDTLENCTSKRLSNSEIELYHSNKLFGSIKGQVPSTSDIKAIRLCKNKIETEKLLVKHNIPTTKSILLSENDYDKGLELLSKSKTPMVLKPYNLQAGKGITLNVNVSNFEFAWNLAQNEYEQTPKFFKVLLQPMLKGIESRVLIIEGEFNSAILRLPANIVGDGKHTIKQLIDKKNKARLKNPHLAKLPIKISKTLKHNLTQINKSLNTTLKADEIIFLHNSSNVSLGGDSYEISHLIGENLINLAEDAISAIPDINTAGVDIMFETFNDLEAKVLEINPGANLRMHHYPLKGKPKTPIHDLVDKLHMTVS